MSENNIDKDYIPPCESDIKSECNDQGTDTEIDIIPDNQWFDVRWFNNEWNEYKIQWTNEDPAIIVLELFENTEVNKNFKDFFRNSETIAKIGNIQLKKWDKITLDLSWIWQYELNIWKKTYAVETVQNKVYEVK